MSYYAAIVGGLMDTAGTALKGFAADDKKDEVLKVGQTPGIDVWGLAQEDLLKQQGLLPQASALSSGIGQANQSQLMAREEQAMPGIGAARQQALARVRGLFSDDSEWLKGVQRRGAALGLSSGLFGSQAGQLQTLRLSDQEQMTRTQLGTGLLGSLIGSMRIANTPGVQSFLGPDANQLINIRSGERAQRMNIGLQAAGMPTMADVWGNELQSVGKSMAGVGVGSAMAGGGGGGGGMMGGQGALDYGGGGGASSLSTSSGSNWGPYFNANDAAAISRYAGSY